MRTWGVLSKSLEALSSRWQKKQALQLWTNPSRNIGAMASNGTLPISRVLLLICIVLCYTVRLHKDTVYTAQNNYFFCGAYSCKFQKILFHYLNLLLITTYHCSLYKMQFHVLWLRENNHKKCEYYCLKALCGTVTTVPESAKKCFDRLRYCIHDNFS